jgi:hypothetical protein
MSTATNITVNRNKFRAVQVTVYGPGGPSASPPDIDSTTVITNAMLSISGPLVAAVDPLDNRIVNIGVAVGAPAGVAGPVTLTVAGKPVGKQFVTVPAAPDLSDVDFGTAGGEQPLPLPV